MVELKSLYEKKAKVYKDLNDLRGRCRKEGKMTPEDKEQFDKWNKEFDEIEDLIQMEERVSALESKTIEKVEEVEKSTETVDVKKQYEKAFEKYVIYGLHGLTPEENRILSTGIPKLTDTEKQRAATASSTTTTTGGYTIPEGFSGELEMAMEYTGPFTETNGPYRAYNTASGNDIPWPTIDDTANDGFLQTEATEDAQDSSVGLTFGEETLKSYVYNSGVIPVTIQLDQDSYFNFGAIVGELIGERLGRTLNYQATLGSGSSLPEGVTVGSNQGKYSASATAFTHAEMLDFVASVNRKYRSPSNPKVGWMFHSQIEAEVRKLDASTTNYTQGIWQPSFAAGSPATVLGYKYWINDDMASTLATGNKIFLFGDFNKFVIRKVGGVNLFRFNERFMEYLKVAFMAWIRFDSRVMQANAIKYFDLT